MTIQTANMVASKMKMAPEISKAMQAIELPEVRDMLRRLAEYNLGVCIPHMHRTDLDFDMLPSDTVQVEEDGHVSWLARVDLDPDRGSIPVAWRWTSNGAVNDVECIQTCSPNEKKGHKKGHL